MTHPQLSWSQAFHQLNPSLDVHTHILPCFTSISFPFPESAKGLGSAQPGQTVSANRPLVSDDSVFEDVYRRRLMNTLNNLNVDVANYLKTIKWLKYTSCACAVQKPVTRWTKFWSVRHPTWNFRSVRSPRQWHPQWLRQRPSVTLGLYLSDCLSVWSTFLIIVYFQCRELTNRFGNHYAAKSFIITNHQNRR